MTERNRRILIKRGKTECIDSGCEKVLEMDLGYSTTLVYCKVHGLKEQIAGKIEHEVMGSEVSEVSGVAE